MLSTPLLLKVFGLFWNYLSWKGWIHPECPSGIGRIGSSGSASVEVDCSLRCQSGVSVSHVQAELEQLHEPILFALASAGALPAPAAHYCSENWGKLELCLNLWLPKLPVKAVQSPNGTYRWCSILMINITEFQQMLWCSGSTFCRVATKGAEK